MGVWKQDLFGCFSNCGLCIFTLFCPCVTFGRVAEKMGESCMTCGFCIMVPIGNFLSWLKIREKVREANSIEGSTVNDCLMGWCCGFCALVQMAAEVDDAQVQAMVRE